MAETIIIVGSGPAAYTAAIYASRAELNPLLFEGVLDDSLIPGGQLMTTTEVENFPGFPDGITGPDLVERMAEQAKKFGTRVKNETVVEVEVEVEDGGVISLVTNTGTQYTCKALIVATGANARRLSIPGAQEGEFWQKGVSACAVCDGALPIFRNKVVLVIGGGDSAMEEATFLTKYASKVYIVHRRDELRASKIMQNKAKSNPKIEFLYSHVVTAVKGDRVMKKAEVEDLKTGERREIEANGLFFAIGHEPNVKFLKGKVQMDEQGYIVTTPGSTITTCTGIFAAGDVQDKRYRQAVSAAGSGCMAALDAEHYLSSL